MNLQFMVALDREGAVVKFGPFFQSLEIELEVGSCSFTVGYSFKDSIKTIDSAEVPLEKKK